MQRDILAAVERVLCSATRLRVLGAEGGSTALSLVRFLTRIVPLARRELRLLEVDALAIPDQALREQALASIHEKSFHVAGACILATFLPSAFATQYVRIVVPLESIYDYLDNLCDRHPIVAPQAYPILHGAIADALDPRAPLRDYYAYGPTGDDGGYLASLVHRVQRALDAVTRTPQLDAAFEEAARLYAQMQTNVHLSPAQRIGACVDWYDAHRLEFAELDWHEFACAAGSQFQVYGPLYAAMVGDDIAATSRAYFPYVSALHVLFDSFIDRAEDAASGDLNFVGVYPSARALRERARLFAERAAERYQSLAHPARHRFVLRTMALFYLSHAKLREPGDDREALALLQAIVAPLAKDFPHG